MPKHTSIAACSGMFAAQNGLADRAQLESVVSSRTVTRWVDEGLLVPVRRRVYRLAGTTSSWTSEVLAVTMSAGTLTVASHRSAARLHRLDGIRFGGIEVVSRAGRRCKLDDVVVHESVDLRDGDITVVGVVPSTTVVRTLIDLGAVCGSAVVEQAVDDALRRRLCSLADVELRFEELARSGRNGIGVLRPILEERLGKDLAPATGFEQRMIRLVRAAGLPDPVRQHRVAFPGGGHGFLDLAWPDIRLAVECDDLASHFASHRLRWDDQRQNELVLLGWTVLRFTFHDVRDLPHRTAELLTAGYRRCASQVA